MLEWKQHGHKQVRTQSQNAAFQQLVKEKQNPRICPNDTQQQQQQFSAGKSDKHVLWPKRMQTKKTNSSLCYENPNLVISCQTYAPLDDRGEGDLTLRTLQSS